MERSNGKYFKRLLAVLALTMIIPTLIYLIFGVNLFKVFLTLFVVFEFFYGFVYFSQKEN